MKRVLSALLLLAIALPAAARAEDPSAGLPTVGAARRSPVSRAVLPNGMKVLVQESPAEDIVAVELLVRVGIAHEESPVAGITNLIQEVLVNRVSRDDSGDDLVEITGSLVESTAEPDYARLSILTTAEHLPQVIGRLASALERREMTPEETADVRDKLVQALKGGQGAFSQLYEIFLQHFYRYHPYRRTGLGSEVSLQRLDPSTVNPYFQRFYVPNRMVLSVAGRVNRSAISELVRQKFGGLQPAKESTLEIPWEPKAVKKEVYLSANSRLAWVFLGFAAPGARSPDHASMTVVQALLAEGLSSRLWVELREQNGLAYELGSLYPELEGPSHFMAYVITRPNSANDCRARIEQQVERLKQEPVSPSELEQTRRKLVGNHLLARETNRGKAFYLALAELIGVGYEADLSFVADIEHVTPADVRRVAGEYLQKATVIVARPPGLYWDDY